MRDGLSRLAERVSVVALAALLVTLPFWRFRVLIHRPGDPVFFEFHDVTLYTNDLVWGLALGAWLVSRLMSRTSAKEAVPRRPAWQWGPAFLAGPLMGLLALGIVGLPWAVDPVYAGYQALRVILLLASFLMMVNLPLRPGIIAWPLAAGVAIQAAAGIPQSLVGHSLGLKSWGEVTVQAAWSGASVVMVGEQRWLRAYGFTQHPNLLGGLLMASLLAIGGYYLGRSGGRRALLLVALGLGMATLLLTFSRAAWLGAVAGGLTLVGVIVWARWRGQRLAVRSSVVSLTIVVIVVLLTFVAIYWPLLQPRLGLVSQGVEIRSVDARVMQIKASWTLIRMRPLLGVGLGNFPTALYRLAPETMAAYPVFEPVHNVALLSTAELGVLGGALWLCLLFSPWHALWLRRREMRLNPWWAGLSAALAGLTVVSFLDAYVWSSHQGRLMLWLVWGLWAREWVNSRAAPSEKEPIPTRVE